MHSSNRKGFYLVSSTEGCSTNLYESSSYEQHLISQGIVRVNSPENADYIIINTCGYNENMQSKSSKIILDLKEKYGKDKQIIVAGCFPAMDKNNFKKNINLPHILPGEISALDNILNLSSGERINLSPAAAGFDISDKKNFTFTHKIIFKARHTYFSLENIFSRRFQPLHNLIDSALVNNTYTPLLTGVGCLGKCSFCSIKMAKGTIKSTPLETLKVSFENLIQSGNSKVWLLGDDIGCWGQDLGLNSAALLNMFLSFRLDFQLVVTNFDPEWLLKYSSDLIKIFSDKRIVSVNFPIQSGSDQIVLDMKRNYSLTAVYQAIKKIKKENPALGIKTDLIVGYPGETWKDFYKSFKAIFHFDAIFVNSYGKVPNTLASQKENQIHPLVKKLRFNLIALAANMRHLYIALRSLKNPTETQRNLK